MLTSALVAAITTCVISGLRYLARKTKTKRDDQLVDVAEEVLPEVIKGFTRKDSPPPAPRPQARDHRPTK